MNDYHKRLITGHGILLDRMRKDPALLDKARGIAEQELQHARKLNPTFTNYETRWVELLRAKEWMSTDELVEVIRREIRENSNHGKGMRLTSPLIQLLSPQERDFVEHGFDNWWVEHVAEIRENRVYGNSEGEQRLVVSVSGSMENSVVVWRTPDPDLPIGAKAQGSATVASFRRWATKVRPATQDDWDAFSRVEWWRKWHAAFHRQYRRKHQTASGY